MFHDRSELRHLLRYKPLSAFKDLADNDSHDLYTVAHSSSSTPTLKPFLPPLDAGRGPQEHHMSLILLLIFNLLNLALRDIVSFNVLALSLRRYTKKAFVNAILCTPSLDLSVLTV